MRKLLCTLVVGLLLGNSTFTQAGDIPQDNGRVFVRVLLKCATSGDGNFKFMKDDTSIIRGIDTVKVSDGSVEVTNGDQFQTNIKIVKPGTVEVSTWVDFHANKLSIQVPANTTITVFQVHDNNRKLVEQSSASGNYSFSFILATKN